jgi:hypothetical protein
MNRRPGLASLWIRKAGGTRTSCISIFTAYCTKAVGTPEIVRADLHNFIKETVETQLPVMRTRANLWSTGDIERLSSLLRADAVETCASAVLVVPSFQEEYAKLHAQLQSAWLAAAEKAIAANVSTVAVLSMTELLKPDGWLALFRARGYEITEP